MTVLEITRTRINSKKSDEVFNQTIDELGVVGGREAYWKATDEQVNKLTPKQAFYLNNTMGWSTAITLMRTVMESLRRS